MVCELTKIVKQNNFFLALLSQKQCTDNASHRYAEENPMKEKNQTCQKSNNQEIGKQEEKSCKTTVTTIDPSKSGVADSFLSPIENHQPINKIDPNLLQISNIENNSTKNINNDDKNKAVTGKCNLTKTFTSYQPKTDNNLKQTTKSNSSRKEGDQSNAPLIKEQTHDHSDSCGNTNNFQQVSLASKYIVFNKVSTVSLLFFNKESKAKNEIAAKKALLSQFYPNMFTSNMSNRTFTCRNRKKDHLLCESGNRGRKQICPILA